MLPNLSKKIGLIVAASTIVLSSFVQATVVEIRTNMGNIQVNLFDQTTPNTVDNFLTNYVNPGAYANNVVHRSVPNFVVQMGGFQYSGSFPPEPISTASAVVNEPVLSNVRGTIAMAKLGGNANSATSQFFINTVNNSTNLDLANGGFTVFGQVLGNGMEVVDAINALTRFNFSGSLGEIPLQNYTTTDYNNNVEPTDNNLVVITDIVVIDANVETNPNIVPVPNTLLNAPSPGESDSGGGSLGFGLIAGLLLISLRRRFK